MRRLSATSAVVSPSTTVCQNACQVCGSMRGTALATPLETYRETVGGQLLVGPAMAVAPILPGLCRFACQPQLH
jgi:hypothetical protein